MGGTKHVDIGGKIRLQCNATGREHIPEDVDWFKDGMKIAPGNHVEITKRRDMVSNNLFVLKSMCEYKCDDMGRKIIIQRKF